MLDSPLPFAGVDNDETIKVSRSGGADLDGKLSHFPKNIFWKTISFYDVW